jgi:hypothetical protein
VSQASFRYDPSEPVADLVVTGITGSTLQELRTAEVRLRADGIRALILDFQHSERSDDFHQARLVADGLLDGGTLWHWHERGAEPRRESADRECLFRGMRLVVVVSQQTGPAHAAIAAALQDAGRAVIVGHSPGFDGTVATGIPLQDEQHVLWMNTARLTRARADRTWPLMPDHPIRSMIDTAHAMKGRTMLTPQTIYVPSAQATPQIVRRNFANLSPDDSVSALFPQNLTDHEIGFRHYQSSLAEKVRQQELLQASRNSESPLPVARRVAREMLKTLPP